MIGHRSYEVIHFLVIIGFVIFAPVALVPAAGADLGTLPKVKPPVVSGSTSGAGWRQRDLSGADAMCVEWTDGCRICRRTTRDEFACSNVAIACIQKEGQCTRR